MDTIDLIRCRIWYGWTIEKWMENLIEIFNEKYKPKGRYRVYSLLITNYNIRTKLQINILIEWKEPQAIKYDKNRDHFRWQNTTKSHSVKFGLKFRSLLKSQLGAPEQSLTCQLYETEHKVSLRVLDILMIFNLGNWWKAKRMVH